MYRRLALALALPLALTACKTKTGVSQEEVEDKIKTSFADKGLELAKVTCPEGPLRGQVDCTGTTADGVPVPITLDIKRDGFLSSKLNFETKGVNVGFVVADLIASSSKEKYGVPLEVTCPAALPAEQTMTCTGTFEETEVTVEFSKGTWNTTSGIVSADAMEKMLRDAAKERGLAVDPAAIDCGPQRVYGASPGRKIACRAGDTRVFIAVDGNGLRVVGEEPIEQP